MLGCTLLSCDYYNTVIFLFAIHCFSPPVNVLIRHIVILFLSMVSGFIRIDCLFSVVFIALGQLLTCSCVSGLVADRNGASILGTEKVRSF